MRYNQANSFNDLSLFKKNEEYKIQILSLEKKLQAVTSELKQNENWKERFLEQKNQISQLNQKIEDLQTRLQISLQSNAELEKKHQESIEQINTQRLSEVIHLKTTFSKKENQQNETIANLKEKNKSLKLEINSYKQTIMILRSKTNQEKEQLKEQPPPQPFSIQIPETDSKTKWKKRYEKEKVKKQNLKALQIQQQEIINDKQHEIEKLEKEIEDKQKVIDSFEIQRNQTATYIQSLQQKVDDIQYQNSTFSMQLENQKKYREQSNNNMEIELASFLTEQNEIHNKKITSLSLKLTKSVQIINELKEKNEKLIELNSKLKEKNKKIVLLENDLNNALFEKDQIIQKVLKKIRILQSKNKLLKKENFEYQHNFSQQSLNSTEIENNSQIIDKFFSIIDSHKNELSNMIQSSSSQFQSIPLNSLPAELKNDLAGNELNFDRIIQWYNGTVKSLKFDSKQLKIMKNVISSCFTDVQFNFENNKVFCEQTRNAINSLKDQLRELTLKQQQMHVSTLNIGNS